MYLYLFCVWIQQNAVRVKWFISIHVYRNVFINSYTAHILYQLTVLLLCKLIRNKTFAFSNVSSWAFVIVGLWLNFPCTVHYLIYSTLVVSTWLEWYVNALCLVLYSFFIYGADFENKFLENVKYTFWCCKISMYVDWDILYMYHMLFFAGSHIGGWA